MSEATATTPVATTPEVSIESLTASRDEAQVKLNEANSEMATKGPELFAASNYEALKPLADAVSRAKVILEGRESALVEYRKTSAWEQMESAREPIRSTFRDLFIDSTPQNPLTGVIATIEVKDGKASASCHLTFSSLDMSTINDLVAGSVDVAAFEKAGISSLTVQMTKIGTPEAIISDKPTPAKGAKVASTSTASTGDPAPRSGALEYSYNGSWLGSKALLQALKDEGHAFFSDHSKSLVWTGGKDGGIGGNGMSTLAKDAAKALKLEDREAPKA